MANPGDLDTSFSGDGKRAIDFGGFDFARDVLIQSDGRIVVAGFGGDVDAPSFCVARLRADGELDPTFGSGGKRTIDFGGDQESAFGNAISVASLSPLLPLGAFANCRESPTRAKSKSAPVRIRT